MGNVNDGITKGPPILGPRTGTVPKSDKAAGKMCVRTVAPTWAIKMLIRPSYDFFVIDQAALLRHRTVPLDRISKLGRMLPKSCHRRGRLAFGISLHGTTLW